MNKKNNLKRKGAANKEVNTKLGKKLKKLSNVELNAYFKTYKNGFSDHHWQLFREAGKIVKVEKVLYPGCHRHITASLVFKMLFMLIITKRLLVVLLIQKFWNG